MSDGPIYDLGGIQYEMSVDDGDYAERLERNESLTSRVLGGMYSAFKKLGEASFFFNQIRDAWNSLSSKAEEWARYSANVIDDTSDMAGALRATTGEFLGMKMAFEQGGMGASQVMTTIGRVTELAMTEMQQKMEDAAEGVKHVAGPLERLGVVATDAAGQLKSPTELLLDLARNLEANAKPAERTTTLIDLFGARGARLEPILSKLSGGFKGLSEDVDTLGMNFTEAEKEGAQRLIGAFARLSQVSEGFWTTIGKPFIEPLTTLIDAWSDLELSMIKVLRQTGIFEVSLDALAAPLRGKADLMNSLAQEVGYLVNGTRGYVEVNGKVVDVLRDVRQGQFANIEVAGKHVSTIYKEESAWGGVIRRIVDWRGTLKTAWDWVKSAGGKMLEWWNEGWDWIYRHSTEIWAGIKSGAETAWEKMKLLGAWLYEEGPKAWAVIKVVAGATMELLVKGVLWLYDNLPGLAETFLTIKRAVELVWAAVDGLWDAIKHGARIFKNVLGDAWIELGKAFWQFVEVLRGAWFSIMEWWDAPMEISFAAVARWLKTAMGWVTDALGWISKQLETLHYYWTMYWKDAWDFLYEKTMKVWGLLKPYLEQAWGWLSKQFNWLRGYMGLALEWIELRLGRLWDWIVMQSTLTWESLVGFIDDVLEGTMRAFTAFDSSTTKASSRWDLFRIILDSVLGFIRGVLDGMGFMIKLGGTVFGFLARGVAGLALMAGEAWAEMFDQADGFWGFLKRLGGNLLDLLWRLVKAVWEVAKPLLVGLAAGVLGLFAVLLDANVRFFKWLGNKAWDSLVWLGGKLKDFGGWVLDILKWLGTGAWSLVKWAVGSIWQLGKWLLIDMLVATVITVAAFFHRQGSWLLSLVAWAVDATKGQLKVWYAAATGYIYDWASYIYKVVSGVVDWFLKKWQQIQNLISSIKAGAAAIVGMKSGEMSLSYGSTGTGSSMSRGGGPTNVYAPSIMYGPQLHVQGDVLASQSEVKRFAGVFKEAQRLGYLKS